jgi:hypothetical protein
MRPLLALLLLSVVQIPAFAQKTTVLYLASSSSSCITPDVTISAEEEFTFAAYVGSHSGDGVTDYVDFEIRNSSLSMTWSLSFDMPNGQSLAPGDYFNATRSGGPSDPGISLTGNGCAYSTVSGFFTIHEVTLEDGKLASFAADFIQFNEMALASWTLGSIRYDSDVPVDDIPPGPVRPMSVACTNPDGPLVVESGYQWSSTCIASGGVSPYAWSFLNLPAGLKGEGDIFEGPNAVTISGRPNPGLFDYTVTATDSDNNVASQQFVGTTTHPDCVPRGTYRTSAQTSYFPPSGGTAIRSFSFMSEGCPWTMTSDIPGIAFLPASGITRGHDSLENSRATVPANNSYTPLVGHFFLSENGTVVMSYPVVVNSNSCSYTVSPEFAQFGPEGGSGTFTVTGNPESCHRHQLQYYGWLHSEDGLYYYAIPPNSGAAQSGTVGFGNFYGDASIAAFSWEQQAGDGSLVMNCYKHGPSKLNSAVANCMAAGGTPPYKWSVISGSVPGDTIYPSSDSSQIAYGNPRQSGPYQFTVRVMDSAIPSEASATHTVSGTVLPSPPEFQCSIATIPTQTEATYKSICVPSNGTPPYRWSINEGALPPGIVLSELDDGSAIISGVPSSTGDYSYRLQLMDSSDPFPMTATYFFMGSIGSAESTSSRFSIGCAVNDGELQIGFPIRPIICTAYGGTLPYKWSVHSGQLPTGLEFTQTTGDTVTIEGTPTERIDNDYFYSYIKAVDGSSVPRARIRKLRLKIVGPTDFSCFPITGKVGQSYYSACEGLPLDTWISDGELPPGLAVSYKGITGVPTTPGTYTFEVSAQLGIYPTPTNTYTMEIASVPQSTTIRTNPDGRSFSADGTVYSSPHTFSWLVGSQHTISVGIQPVGEGARYVFAGWSDGGDSSHTITLPAAATTYTANFTLQYKLTASASPPHGGSLSAIPASADGYYAAGSSVKLTATASNGYSFSGWSGLVSGTTNPQNIAMSAPRSVSATFQPVGTTRLLRLPPQKTGRIRQKRNTRSLRE